MSADTAEAVFYRAVAADGIEAGEHVGAAGGAR